MKETDTTVIPKLPLNRSQKVVRAIKWTLIGSLVFILCWRQYRVWRIPDVEPFDETSFITELSDHQDVGVFHEAAAMLEKTRKTAPQLKPIDGISYVVDGTDSQHLELPPESKALVEAYRAASDKWWSGEQADRFYAADPRNFSLANANLFQASNEFGLLLAIENYWLVRDGKPNDAIRRFKDALPVMTKFGEVRGRLISYDLQSRVLPYILNSLAVEADELRQLQDGLSTMQSELTNVSDEIKFNHLVAAEERRKQLAAYPVSNLLTNEEEVARRVANRFTVNHLQYCDLPWYSRPERKIEYSGSGSPRWVNQFRKNYGIDLDVLGLWGRQSGEIRYFRKSADDEGLSREFHSLTYATKTVHRNISELNALYSYRDHFYSIIERDLTIIAVHRFYRDKGHFPSHMNDLVPEYLLDPPQLSSGLTYQIDVKDGDCLLIPKKTDPSLNIVIPAPH